VLFTQSLYPGWPDADETLKADLEIMRDEMVDKMETPPAGYQGQITLRVSSFCQSEREYEGNRIV